MTPDPAPCPCPPGAGANRPRFIRTLDDLRQFSTEDSNGCWLWQGNRRATGYAVVDAASVRWYVHRLAYTLGVGPIPEGMTVDHVCWVRHCINPEHFQLLTSSENAARQKTKFATHCPSGKHLKTPDNTAERPKGGKSRVGCLDCRREYQRAQYQKNRERMRALANARVERNRDKVNAQWRARYWAQKAQGESA